MAADEIQAAIDRAEGKPGELEAAQPKTRESAKILAALPRATDLYCKQIDLGLDGGPREAHKARVIVRQLFGGKIVLSPGEDGSLWATGELQPAALVQGVGTDGGQRWN